MSRPLPGGRRHVAVGERHDRDAGGVDRRRDPRRPRGRARAGDAPSSPPAWRARPRRRQPFGCPAPGRSRVRSRARSARIARTVVEVRTVKPPDAASACGRVPRPPSSDTNTGWLGDGAPGAGVGHRTRGLDQRTAARRAARPARASSPAATARRHVRRRRRRAADRPAGRRPRCRAAARTRRADRDIAVQRRHRRQRPARRRSAPARGLSERARRRAPRRRRRECPSIVRAGNGMRAPPRAAAPPWWSA